MQKVNDVHSELHIWEKEVSKGNTNRIKELKEDLEKMRRGSMTDAHLVAQIEQEEIYWIQRAHANWMKHGDRNTNFFKIVRPIEKERMQ